MKAADLHEHLKAVGEWVDWEHTCDGFKAGSPDTRVTSIAVAWQSTLQALSCAHDEGCDLFVTHEPTFYVHMDDDESVFRHTHALRKKEMLAEWGMVVYRCHDVWDVMPEIGIVDSWARGLGFEGRPLASRRYYSVYQTEERTLGNLARRIARKTREVGQPAVEVVGRLEIPVSKVALGTGAITDVRTMFDMGADVVVTTDDGISYWSAGCWVQDSNIPMIVCNHAAAEEWGIRNLADYLRRTFPNIRVIHIPQGCPFTLVADR